MKKKRGYNTRIVDNSGRKQCSCMGENPNCYKCGGWGYLAPVKQPRPTMFGLFDYYLPKPKKVVPKPKVPCPQCGVHVFKLSKHLQKAHGKEKSTQPLIANLTSCPHCGVPVKGSRLSSHIARVHKIPVKEESGRVRQFTPLPPSNVTPSNTRSNLLQAPQSDDHEMDYSRPYAHAYREHGRFGSHPSHDDFGDESTP